MHTCLDTQQGKEQEIFFLKGESQKKLRFTLNCCQSLSLFHCIFFLPSYFISEILLPSDHKEHLWHLIQRPVALICQSSWAMFPSQETPQIRQFCQETLLRCPWVKQQGSRLHYEFLKVFFMMLRKSAEQWILWELGFFSQRIIKTY